jgi:hypothetical protein
MKPAKSKAMAEAAAKKTPAVDHAFTIVVTLTAMNHCGSNRKISSKLVLFSSCRIEKKNYPTYERTYNQDATRGQNGIMHREKKVLERVQTSFCVQSVRKVSFIDVWHG